jgi:hypothetical protein
VECIFKKLVNFFRFRYLREIILFFDYITIDNGRLTHHMKLHSINNLLSINYVKITKLKFNSIWFPDE